MTDELPLSPTHVADMCRGCHDMYDRCDMWRNRRTHIIDSDLSV